MINYKQFVILCQRHSGKALITYLENHVLRIKVDDSNILESDNVYQELLIKAYITTIQTLTYNDILPFIATKKDKRKMLWLNRHLD